jgi:hypothetical protein
MTTLGSTIRPRYAIGAALVATIICAGARAIAQTPEPFSFDRERFIGKAEVGLGLIALPTAQVCTNRALLLPCKLGDTSPMLDIWQLFRPSPVFAAGAGVTIGLFPITDAPQSEPAGVSRDHRRGYFTAEAMARMYWLRGPIWESWLGVTSGLAVISDTYITNNNVTDVAFVGPRGVTIRTEGFTLGLAAGVAESLSEAWTVGAGLRYALWFLPSVPARDALGDEASLIGRVGTFVIGVNLGYRMKL